MAGFCFLGAVRKYRRDDVLAFVPQVALLMLIGWLGLSMLGIRYHDVFEFRAFARGPHDPQIPVVGSVVSALLFGILPVMSGVWQRRQWLGRRARQDTALGSPPMAPEMIAISAAAFIAIFGLSIRNSDWPYLAITTAGAALAFLLAMTYLLGIMYRASTRGGLIIGLFIFVTWLLPFGLEGARYAMQQDLFAPELTWLSTCSPIGALIAATSEGGPSPLPGMLVQFVPAVLLGLLYYRPRRRVSQMN